MIEKIEPFEEWVGHRYNRWEIISMDYVIKDSKPYFMCKCHCPVCADGHETPTIKYVRHYYLYSERSKQCVRGQGYDKMIKNNPSHKKLNKYDLTHQYGLGYITKDNCEVTFKFDLEDYSIISKYTWHATKQNYARTIIRIGKNKFYQISMHRTIMGLDDSNENKLTYVDHINHDTLDNRKENLRICTPSENSINSKKRYHIDGRGIYKQDKKWMVRFRRQGKRYYGGMFENYEDALSKRISMEPDSEFVYKDNNEE